MVSITIDNLTVKKIHFDIASNPLILIISILLIILLVINIVYLTILTFNFFKKKKVINNVIDLYESSHDIEDEIKNIGKISFSRL